MATSNLTRKNQTLKICPVEGCGKFSKHRTMCWMHQDRVRRYGTTEKQNWTLKSLPQRFWSKVDKTTSKKGCWLWTGAKTFSGYGKISFQSESRTATHVVWFLTYGIFPTLDILHDCDNPPCVNPAHLHEGTHAQNMQEGFERNRFPQGENRNFAKLSNHQVLEIKKRLDAGNSISALATDYHVSYSTIMRIRNGNTWKSVLE